MADELEMMVEEMPQGQEMIMMEEMEEDLEPTPIDTLISFIQSENIVDDLDDQMLSEIQADCTNGYEEDKTSRAEWESVIEEIHDVLKMEKKGEKTYPWPGASNINFPLILSSVLQFNARAYPALIGDRDVIKCKVFGDDPQGMKAARADRLGEALNYQILEDMNDWTGDMDTLTTVLPVDGCAFKKVYFDEKKKKVCSEFIYAMDLIVNNEVRDLDKAPRISQMFGLYPYEVTERVNLGMYKQEETADDDEAEFNEEMKVMIEQYVRLDLDEDGYREPYIVTFDEETGHIYRITANYNLDDIQLNDEGNVQYINQHVAFVKYKFFQSVDGSFYNPGLGMLLKPINDSVSSILNQLVDSGHLANTGGGFISNNFRLKSGATKFSPGEWKKVDVGGGTMRDSIMPLPVPQPSNVLFSLLGLLIDAGKEISSIQDVMTGGGDPAAPVGTTLALIEQGTKVYSAVLKRMYRSMKEEFKMIYKLDSIHGDPMEYAEMLDNENARFDVDFNLDDFDVVPAADPAMITDVQKAAKAQFLMQQAPPPPLNSQMVWSEAMTVAGIENPEQYLAPPPQGPTPDQMIVMAEMELKNRELAIKEAELGIKAESSFFDNMKKVADVGKITAETDEKGGDFNAIAETSLATQGISKDVRQRSERTGPMEGGQPPVPQGPAGPVQGM